MLYPLSYEGGVSCEIETDPDSRVRAEIPQL